MAPSTFFLLLVTAAVAFPITASGISNPSLDALLDFLRTNGHAFLANSIATSDLVSGILPLQTLTLLAPPDTSLMTQPPSAYLSTLRLHLIPFSVDLNPKSDSSSRLLPTLLPSRSLSASFSGEGNLLLDGVPVLLPRAYLSGDISVYRLSRPLPSSSPPMKTHNFSILFAPAPVDTATANQTPVVPVNHLSASLAAQQQGKTVPLWVVYLGSLFLIAFVGAAIGMGMRKTRTPAQPPQGIPVERPVSVRRLRRFLSRLNRSANRYRRRLGRRLRFLEKFVCGIFLFLLALFIALLVIIFYHPV